MPMRKTATTAPLDDGLLQLMALRAGSSRQALGRVFEVRASAGCAEPRGARDVQPGAWPAPG